MNYCLVKNPRHRIRPLTHIHATCHAGAIPAGREFYWLRWQREKIPVPTTSRGNASKLPLATEDGLASPTNLGKYQRFFPFSPYSKPLSESGTMSLASFCVIRGACQWDPQPGI
ncbi:hypothetical protein PAXRUDRAFT_827868 [Paxillus rubicundulus Ve08.2h10]|uniref:Uncharacterized protein n=1 Tax=Paxillus rubicundulus Ve08.2h10 TaxID=930991 RepID=A0A0D0DX28_9AGAM|nr:hypothetical protein PAXRUDRAFT_827868 [Paxillus rubicundulus Ve08.2h10]